VHAADAAAAEYARQQLLTKIQIADTPVTPAPVLMQCIKKPAVF